MRTNRVEVTRTGDKSLITTDRFRVDMELEFYVHADPVRGDQRLVAGAFDLHAVGAHVDLLDLVQEGERQTAAGEDHLLAAESGAHQRDVASGFTVETVHERHDDGDGDDRNNDR